MEAPCRLLPPEQRAPSRASSRGDSPSAIVREAKEWVATSSGKPPESRKQSLGRTPSLDPNKFPFPGLRTASLPRDTESPERKGAKKLPSLSSFDASLPEVGARSHKHREEVGSRGSDPGCGSRNGSRRRRNHHVVRDGGTVSAPASRGDQVAEPLTPGIFPDAPLTEPATRRHRKGDGDLHIDRFFRDCSADGKSPKTDRPSSRSRPLGSSVSSPHLLGHQKELAAGEEAGAAPLATGRPPQVPKRSGSSSRLTRGDAQHSRRGVDPLPLDGGGERRELQRRSKRDGSGRRMGAEGSSERDLAEPQQLPGQVQCAGYPPSGERIPSSRGQRGSRHIFTFAEDLPRKSSREHHQHQGGPLDLPLEKPLRRPSPKPAASSAEAPAAAPGAAAPRLGEPRKSSKASLQPRGLARKSSKTVPETEEMLQDSLSDLSMLIGDIPRNDKWDAADSMGSSRFPSARGGGGGSASSSLKCQRGPRGVLSLSFKDPPPLDGTAELRNQLSSSCSSSSHDPFNGTMSSPNAVRGEAGLTWVKGEVLGHGQLGTVYKALDQKTGQMFAVKEVRFDSKQDSDVKFLRALENEVSIYKELSHPHIVSYLGHDYLDHYMYIYLEFMAGGSVAQVLSQFGPLDESLIATYSRELLEGLEYLHTRTPVVLHRDIKGANILVGLDCKVKLSDFGCSKRAVDTLAQSLRGSIPWMAPEVIKQTGYGRRSDVWSLGCVTIEMATAKHPWGTFDNPMAAMMRIGMSGDTPPLPDNVSEACRAFIQQCTQRDKELRPLATQLLQHEFVQAEHGDLLMSTITTFGA